MPARLRPLKRYNKKNALKLNNFYNYKPGSGKITVNLNSLETSLSGVYIAKSKQHFLNAQKSNEALIYYRAKGFLYFNQNGSKERLGSGGVIAKFNKKPKLSTSDFNFKGTSVDAFYSLLPSSSAVKENHTFQISIKYSNVKPGTRLYGSISGINASDISGSLNTSFKAKKNGKNILTIQAIADQLTEGDESFVYKLYSDRRRKNLVAKTKSITIQDTSKDSQVSSIFKNESTMGELTASEEFDYLSFNADANSLVSFTLSSSSDNLYPQIYIFDESGNQIAKNNAYNNSSASIGLTSLKAGGNFYLKITSQIPGRSSSYNITSQLTNTDQLKNDVIRLSNLEREKSGLRPLKHDTLLEKAAQSHVEDMNSSGRYLAHTGSNGSSPGDRIKSTGYQAAWHDLGNGSLRYVSQENAAAGHTSAAQVVDAWMNSTGHRAAIMDPHTEEIGVGFEIDDVSGRTYWIQTFGIPWSPGDNRYF